MGSLQTVRLQERRIKRRLKTKLNELEFLSDIVGLSKKGKKLVEPLFKFFKYLNLSVHRPPKKDSLGIEDLRVFYENMLLIIEISSIDNDRAGDPKLTQILKHIKIRQSEFPNLKVMGLTIINHQDTEHFTKRVKQQNYQDKTVKILKSHELTSVTTLTLLINFIKIKKGEMTVNDLINGLTSHGIYEI